MGLPIWEIMYWIYVYHVDVRKNLVNSPGMKLDIELYIYSLIVVLIHTYTKKFIT